MTARLTVDRIAAGYGGIEAINDVSIEVAAGEAVALIGANGAGKTTTLRSIVGLLVLRRGRIELDGIPIERMSPERRVRAGLGYAPEGRRVFPGLTVHENLVIACWDGTAALRQRLAFVYELFPQLVVKERALGWQLSGGQQTMLSVGRALMGGPRMLLLDEPSLGLSPKLAAEVTLTLRSITAAGCSVLLAEQNVSTALAVCERAYVMETGRVVRADRSSALLASDAIRQAYLGGFEAAP
jgi:branched-chain amino acid transport system ATP-binding protein